MAATAEKPPTVASADWRSRERRRQTTAHALHRAAATDLAQLEPLWAGLPTDGLVDDLLTLRHASDVPSVHLSRAAAKLAVMSCIAEMVERRGAVGWAGCSLGDLIDHWHEGLPHLANPDLAALAERLPRLRTEAESLQQLADDELARVAGRTYEFGLTTTWVFRTPTDSPERVWHVWRAKQVGCFFTPDFIARHLAMSVLDEHSMSILDPAVGGAAFLIEAYLWLRELRVADAAERLHGVELDGALTDLSALIVEFLDGADLAGKAASRTRFQTGDSLLTPVHRRSTEGSWMDWFPSVMAGGGFDAVLMNPPYLQLKVNHSSLPCRPGDTREMENLRRRAVDEARTNARDLSARLRSSEDFRFAHGGVPDLPRFFIERALALLRPGGKLGCIVPSTFLADHRSRGVRRHLLADHTVREIDLLPEDTRLFADVNQPTCLLVAQRGFTKDSTIRLRTGIRSPASLVAEVPVEVSPALLRAVDPEELRVPSCAPEDWDVLSALHRHPNLADHPWVENLRGELDLTQDRQFISPAPTGLPLVRGDQVERYTSALPSDKPRWVKREFLRESVSHRKLQHIERLRVVGRQCSYLKKARRLSFALIEPGSVVGNSCNYLLVNAGDEQPLSLFLLAALNSAVLEWRFRLTSSTNHVGNYELDALPIPEPDASLVARVCDLAQHLLSQPDNTIVDRELDELWFDAYRLNGAARERITAAVHG